MTLLATTGKPQERKQWKWSLIRRLFERGYNREQVVPPAIVEAVNSISDVARLKQLLRQAIAVASVEEFQQLLAQSGEVG